MCLSPCSFDWHPWFLLVCMDKQYLAISWTDQQSTQHMRGNYFSPSIQTLLCTLSNYLLKAAWNVAWLRLAKLVLESDEWELRASVFTHQLSLSCWLPVQIFRRVFIHFWETFCTHNWLQELMRLNTKDNSPGCVLLEENTEKKEWFIVDFYSIVLHFDTLDNNLGFLLCCVGFLLPVKSKGDFIKIAFL